MLKAGPKIFIMTWLLFLVAGYVSADENLPQRGQNELNAVAGAAKAVLKIGPAEIPIADQAVLHLPEGYGYVPSPQSRLTLRALHIETSDTHQGIIIPMRKDGGKSWLMVVNFCKDGYIKDDTSKNWKTDELLKQILNNTETTNKILRKNGFREREFMGWVEPPFCDRATHRLVWSVAYKDKRSLSSIQVANYNTLAFGREGYISMQMSVIRDGIELLKPAANNLLASLSYNDGKKYTDFIAGTDKEAAYGLAAVVTEKVGVIAPVGANVGISGKIVIALGVGFIALASYFIIKFRGRQKSGRRS